MGMLTKLLRSWVARSTPAPSKPSEDDRARPISGRLGQDFAVIKQAFGGSVDVAGVEISLDPQGRQKIGLAYIQGLVNSAAVQDLTKESLILRASDFGDALIQSSSIAEKEALLRNLIAPIGSIARVGTIDEVLAAMLSGFAVILAEGLPCGFSTDTRKDSDRTVEEPATQSVVRGPREGFTESLETNVSLVRKRIRSPQLWLETSRIGRATQTEVGLMYLKGTADEAVIEEARRRLARIDIDGILESSYIEELIQDETATLFPTMYNTERPDVTAAGLLEGRIAIVVDGTPFVLLAPALFIQFYQSAEDYYQRFEFATLIRLLRYVCFFITLLAPALYIAITTFHQELLPSPLLFNLAAQREGIPFPAFVEALIMEVTFEILREAGVRLPKTVGQAVSIVGALVIGQSAVEAGLVSPGMVIVVAITAISNFVIPSFNMGISIRILRFVLMVIAAIFGLFGVTMGLVAIVQHLCTLRSFGVPYMSPMAPYNNADQKDTILRLPQWAMFARPRHLTRNRIRQRDARAAGPRHKD
ncbi:spore germination protein [Paenibacillus sp. IB182496]|uniref:Spore germination protein n=2 Tax=Paenibacillus sabuli TaxID=2772509 RepID=A0A927BSR8_9BACL|nr:spore germination protein [Paenibacillus sabuli]MBD2845617.1 spore germination protein [Paenibacillus sabuli]